ncbi:hypothetical protein MFIFM68171_09899 [Madurella fahalii]|uniref:Uncharacterized protein n=1 Tax=Madurella fahalii TaxID=1157608 RepID=A0ABQ0GPQ5_9PEZI
MNDTLPASAKAPDVQSSLGLSGVDLIAMVVSDSGLANCEPKWWNASPTGCMLIGLQPRGGWQILQRAVQWGSDSWANCFGVDCATPTLYAYFACTIRNRLEVLASRRLRSPMEDVPAGGAWNTKDDFTVKRPTKLIDGSRGGQAFMAEVLAPETGTHYSIADQARLQMLSVLMVGAGLAVDDSLENYMGTVLPADFDLSDGLGSVFGRLAIGLVAGSLLVVLFMLATWWSLMRGNLFGSALPYMVKIVSLMSWAVGATGLLMLGGNPRVRLVVKGIPDHIKKRLASLKDGADLDSTETCTGPVLEASDKAQSTKITTEVLTSHENDETLSGLNPKATTCSSKVETNRTQNSRDTDPKVKIQFGSLHGSVFLPDRGFCVLRSSLVERLCAIDILTVRTVGWYLGMAWFGLLLLGSIALQVGSTLAPAFGADLLGLVFLLVTALARGAGVAGPEEWMIPRWKRRQNASNGAVLLGQFNSRAGLVEA